MTESTDALEPAGDVVKLTVDDGVATIRLDRPPMNALNVAMQTRLAECAAEVGERKDVGAVVIYGGPKLFAAGADVKEMADWGYQDMVDRSTALTNSFAAIALIPKPVIAAVTGFALGGGCELALCADLRVAADNAKFGQPEILLGIIPGAGGTQRLPRLIGPARAKDLIFTGRFVDAAEALAMGLVDRVVSSAEVYDTAVALARQLALGPPYALRAAKESIDRGFGVDLGTGLEIERTQFAALFATPDRATGMASFIESGPGKAKFAGR